MVATIRSFRIRPEVAAAFERCYRPGGDRARLFARAAGFELDARSELNANPKDDHDHPYGVWTLPPTRVSAPREGNASDRPTPLTDAERAEYDAIGESDRMTLRFRKPG